MQVLPAIFASIHRKSDAYDDPVDTWSYDVTVFPYLAHDRAVTGHLRIGGPNGTEVIKLECNHLGVDDDLACKLLRIVLNGMLPDMQKLDGDGVEYHSPDCSAWIERTLYRADASRVIRALAAYAKVVRPFPPTMLVTQ